MAGNGFIYILSNESFPHLFKIGWSRKHPLERAAELYTTGLPFPFVVEFAYYVPENAEALEKELHREFSARRKNDNREFFHFRSAQSCIEEVLGAIANIRFCRVLAEERNIIPDDVADRCSMASGLDVWTCFAFLSDEELIQAGERRKQLWKAIRAMSEAERAELGDFTPRNFDLWEELVGSRPELLEVADDSNF